MQAKKARACKSGASGLYCGKYIEQAFCRPQTNNNALVFEPFDEALRIYPNAKPLLHGDREFQYTSRAFRERMERAGIRQSMSRSGRCIDNGPMEGFGAILKTEVYYPNHFKDYNSLEAALRVYMRFLFFSCVYLTGGSSEQTGPVPVALEKIEGGTHGYYHLEDKRIAIAEGMSEL